MRIRLMKLMFESRRCKKLKKSGRDAKSILNIFRCHTLAEKRQNLKTKKMGSLKYGRPVVRCGSFQLVFWVSRQRTCMTLS